MERLLYAMNWESFVSSYLNFHYGIACVLGVVIFGICLSLMYKNVKDRGRSLSVKEILCILVFSIYLTVLFGGTLLNRTVGDAYLIELIPFWSYYEVMTKEASPLFWQMFYNVLVFVPWGLLMPAIWQKMRSVKKTLGSAALISLLIEVVQLVFKLGLFEFDDIFHNVLGAAIGYGVWCMMRTWRMKRV